MVWIPKDPHRCPACKKPVYPAEQIIATDRTPYHRVCVRCVACRCGLTPGTLTEKDGQLYCRMCYQKIMNPYENGDHPGMGQLSDEERYRMERERREREMLEAARQFQNPPGYSAVDGLQKDKTFEYTQLDVRSLTTIAPDIEMVAYGI